MKYAGDAVYSQDQTRRRQVTEVADCFIGSQISDMRGQGWQRRRRVLIVIIN